MHYAKFAHVMKRGKKRETFSRNNGGRIKKNCEKEEEEEEEEAPNDAQRCWPVLSS